jgi:kynurenine formamidase
MRVIDLSWPITDGMMVFPGDVPPTVKKGATMEENGWRTTLVSFSSHTGTHMDAPSHMVPDGKNLDQLPNETFFGFGLVVDVRGCAGRRIELADIKVTSSEISGADYLLFRTGWSEKWGTEDYLKGYPVLSPLSAEWLSEKKLKGVGFDAISVDPVDSASNEIHRILLSSGLVLLENLKNLDKVGYRPFCMAALPISLEDQDGGPVRVMAVLEK